MAAKHHVVYLKRKVLLASSQLKTVMNATGVDPSVVARYTRASKHWDREMQMRIDITNRRCPVDIRPNH